MDHNKHPIWRVSVEEPGRFKHLLTAFNVALFPIVAAVVYFTGGTQYAYLHIMYIPVLLAGFLFGAPGGSVAGLIGGFILGPFMPIDTATGEMQPFFNWFYRMVYFVLLGGIVGFVFNSLRLNMRTVLTAHTHNVDTGIINYNHYIRNYDIDAYRRDRVTMAVQINNYDSLLVLLGREAYHELLRNFYSALERVLGEQSLVFQVDMHRFWAEIPGETFRDIRDTLPETLEQESFYSEQVPLYVDYSIGTSLPDPHKTIHQRFKESDVAALHARNSGVKFAIYHEEYEYDELMFHRLAELPKAIENDRLFLEYQPVVDLRDNTIQSLEVLVRWQTEDGILYPGDFIHLAEETRLIDRLTLWVLERIEQDLERIDETHSSIDIAVNISQKNLLDLSLQASFRKVLDRMDLKQRHLQIEMTESAMMHNAMTTRAFFESLSDYPIKTVLDDFGTGYSSLASLHELPVDMVKIDRGFTLNIEEDDYIYRLVSSIIELTHDLGLEVIAEGVEDESTLQEIKDLGCDYVQGFYFARPMKLEPMLDWLKAKSSGS